MINYNALPTALPEGIDMEKFVVATYYFAVPKEFNNMHALSQFLAIEQTTGTWTPVPGETEEVRSKHVAKVIGVYEAPCHEFTIPADITERTFILQIAFPSVNIEAQLPMLLTATYGNISLAPNLKLLDIRMPKDILDGYKGPKFGIDGMYKLLGVKERRPLLNCMIKPNCGYPLEVGADLFYKAARGGCDMIKDDELIADMKYNLAVPRVKAYMEKERQVYEETGEHTLYAVNITDRLPRMFDLAKEVVAAGANCIMVNYLAVGPEAMRALAEDPDINVPILAHMDLSGSFFSPRQGIGSNVILGKIPRLCGADAIVIPFSLGGKATYLHEKFMMTAQCLRYPFGNLKPTMPMASGGITQANVPDIIRELGTDILIGSGGGVHGHPLGPEAGARAFRKAIGAAMEGTPIEEAAKEDEALGVALGLWGKKTEFKK